MTKYTYDGDFKTLNVRTIANFNGAVTMGSNLTVSGNFTVEGNFTFGDAATDDLTVNGLISTSDGKSSKFIETGTYSSNPDKGIVLSSSNNRPVSFLFDDSESALTGDIRAVLSRVYLSADQNSGVTINAIRGQIKVANDKDLDSANNVVAPITGYFEFAGTANRTVTGHIACIRAAMEGGASGTTTISTNSFLAGFEATLNSSRTYTTTGIMAAFGCNISGGSTKWDKGLYLSGCAQGICFANQGGAESASGLFMGAGTSGDPATTSTADAKFIEFRCQTTATSGDNRLMYLRYDMNGAGASGECIRAFTKMTAALPTARGAHISLDGDTNGSITGLGVAVDAQWLIADTSFSGGTYAVINAEMYSAGSSSDITGVTDAGYIRIVNAGDSTGKGTVDDKAFLFILEGFTSDASHMWYDHQGSAPANVEEWIRVKTPSGTRYIALYNAVV